MGLDSYIDPVDYENFKKVQVFLVDYDCVFHSKQLLNNTKYS